MHSSGTSGGAQSWRVTVVLEFSVDRHLISGGTGGQFLPPVCRMAATLLDLPAAGARLLLPVVPADGARFGTGNQRRGVSAPRQPTDWSVCPVTLIFMSTRDGILDAVCRLVSQRHALPSLDAVAAEAGVSKGGLIHHFRSRAALLDGVVNRELDRVDAAMTEAADRGSAARTWLRLALADAQLIEVYRAMDIVLKALSSGESTLPAVVAARLAHWDDLLAAELGDANQALVVRLVGDGLLLNAVCGTPPASQRVAALVDHLVPIRR